MHAVAKTLALVLALTLVWTLLWRRTHPLLMVAIAGGLGISFMKM